MFKIYFLSGMHYKWLFILLSLTCLLSGFELSRTVDRTGITLGDPLVLKITALKKAGERLRFPGPDADFGEFELLNMKRRTEPRGDRKAQICEYVLTLFKLGPAVLPQLKVCNVADTADCLLTDSVEIIVKPVTAGDTADIVDIHGQARLGFGPLFYLIIGLVVVLLALAVLFIDRYIKSRKKTEEKRAPAIPPEVIFNQELKTLIADRLLEKGEIKPFHFRISEILRKYLGARLDFNALESTTMELTGRLKTHAPGVLRQVEAFCQVNDPAKFTKWIPPTDVSESLVDLAREIVHRANTGQ